jgi:hypothetical protein
VPSYDHSVECFSGVCSPVVVDPAYVMNAINFVWSSARDLTLYAFLSVLGGVCVFVFL